MVFGTVLRVIIAGLALLWMSEPPPRNTWPFKIVGYLGSG